MQHNSSNFLSELEEDDFFAGSEYVGISKQKVYPAKCMSFLKEEPSTELKSKVLSSIAHIWHSGYFKKRNDAIIETGPISKSINEYEELFQFLIQHWIKKYNSDLEKYLSPLFKEKHESTKYLKGKVNYAKFEINQEKNKYKIDSKVSLLSFNINEIKICKSAIMYIYRNSKMWNMTSNTLSKELSRSLHLMQEIEELENPIAVAHDLNSKRINFGNNKKLPNIPSKISGLEDFINFSIDIFINIERGISNSKADPSMNGIVFNLNYLLQEIVSFSLSKIGGTSKDSIFPSRNINKISRFNSSLESLTSNSLEPDTILSFTRLEIFPNSITRDNKEVCVIFDSKHKHMFSNTSVKQKAIDNQNFQQMLAYATTHHREKSCSYIYSFALLAKEEYIFEDLNFSTRSYINFEQADITLINFQNEDQQEVIKIFRVPIKFTQFLYDYYSAKYASSNSPEIIFKLLGEQMLECIKKIDDCYEKSQIKN